jgi:hypothetical protein
MPCTIPPYDIVLIRIDRTHLRSLGGADLPDVVPWVMSATGKRIYAKQGDGLPAKIRRAVGRRGH